jgi:hypothetical protein
MLLPFSSYILSVGLMLSCLFRNDAFFNPISDSLEFTYPLVYGHDLIRWLEWIGACMCSWASISVHNVCDYLL